ncbi:MAG: helix-turn-helix transcriptional regulator [Vicinamibacteria bacterium]
MRSIATTDSRLGFALLGLIDQAPRSGYDLRKVFAQTPLGRFSDSPGTIYPALLRLRRKGWIEPVAEGRPSGRRRQVFRLTVAGRRAFVAWLKRLPTRAEVERDPDGVALRLAFTSQALPPSAVRRFLEAWRREVEAHVQDLQRFLATEGGSGLSVSGRLAFESGLEGFRGHARWVTGALRRLRSVDRPERRRP